jgi:hypothetical protein
MDVSFVPEFLALDPAARDQKLGTGTLLLSGLESGHGKLACKIGFTGVSILNIFNLSSL